jgi:alpha-tubulin suppressor-like RCC1 family protein
MHSCGLVSSRERTSGELGDGTTTTSSVPVAVAGISNAIAVASRASHSCAVLNGGSIQCWGWNSYGELGDGTTTSSSVPFTVSGVSNTIAVVANEYHTCALLSTGSTQCWGLNALGEFGDGRVVG